MAAKKTNRKKSVPEKSTITRIGETIGELAGRIVNKKEQLAAMASDAIESVKTTVSSITAPKKAIVKKVAKRAVKKVAKKLIKPAAKKVTKAVSSPKKSAVKKTIKKAVKKAVKKLPRKK